MVTMDLSLPGALPDITNPVDAIRDSVSNAVPTSLSDLVSNAASTVGGVALGIVGFVGMSTLSFLTGGVATVVGVLALFYGWSLGTSIMNPVGDLDF